jgi:peroxiredoxin
VELFAVSVDPPETSKALKERLESDFTFLCDTEGTLLDALGIRHRNGRPGRDLAFPTAILVDSKGIVRWTYQSDTYRQRARPEEIFRAIEQLSQPRPPG